MIAMILAMGLILFGSFIVGGSLIGVSMGIVGLVIGGIIGTLIGAALLAKSMEIADKF